jgi:hypothetical protein
MTTATHPPGWYPDVNVPGQQRWWDGSEWTEHVQGEQPAWQPPAQQSQGEGRPKRPWYKKKRFLLPLGLVLLMVAVSLGSSGSGSGDNDGTGGTSGASSNDGGGGASGASNDKPAVEKEPAVKKEPAVEKAPEMTSGQENALESAQSYLDMGGFSKAGLIGQLSSSAGEGFSKADATFAANHADADWNKEAVESAQGYLDMGGFSKASLIEQLSSSAGEKFTPAQARYAVSKVY